MAAFELTRNLACPAPGDGNGDPSWLRWIAELPGIVDGLALRWSLRVGRPFQPGGSASWVAPARTSTGERVVLKVGWRHDEALHEPCGREARTLTRCGSA
jgi:streptomycin 6-kinase